LKPERLQHLQYIVVASKKAVLIFNSHSPTIVKKDYSAKLSRRADNYPSDPLIGPDGHLIEMTRFQIFPRIRAIPL
jgi:hypothetical protein